MQACFEYRNIIERFFLAEVLCGGMHQPRVRLSGDSMAWYVQNRESGLEKFPILSIEYSYYVRLVIPHRDTNARH